MSSGNSLQLSAIYLKNFRCFSQITIDLDSPIVLICGANGVGKTSLLEALYYACYLRSFRTHNARDLIALEKDSFFMKLEIKESSLSDSIERTISIGFTGSKRLVKIDNMSTVSYKDLLSHYRVVSLTEDDLMLIKGAPEHRRMFLDQLLLLDNSHFVSVIKEFRAILDQRNSLLNNTRFDADAYFIWSKTLWEKTAVIQTMRKNILSFLEEDINAMLYDCFGEGLSISFSYSAKKKSDLPFKQFWENHDVLLKEELLYKRSLFGVHLDDFIVSLEGKRSRTFASRGQQKMILLLIKAAQIKRLTQEKGPVIFLLDDFMTDFDPVKGSALLSLLFTLQCQLIFTSPHHNSPLEGAIQSFGKFHKKISV